MRLQVIAMSERIVSQISGSPQIARGTEKNVAASHPEELPGTADGPACRWCRSSTTMLRGGFLLVKEETHAALVRAFLIGMIVGVRSLTAPAVLSRAAHLGWLLLENTSLRFLGDRARPTS